MVTLRSHNQIVRALADYPLIQRVFELSAKRGVPVYLVGGTVRDLLLGHEIHDLDFAVQGSGLALARYVADRLGGCFVPLDHERRTGRVLLARSGLPASIPDEHRAGLAPRYVDIASLRGEDLHADLEGRDFTFNAIAIARTKARWQIQDPLHGRKDLGAGILRSASPSSFDNDPVRTLRAVRMQTLFNCSIESQTRDRLRAAVPLLKRVSAERVRDEWFKILQLVESAAALEEMDRLGLLQEIVPEIVHAEDLDRALAAVRAVEALWTALGAPSAQPQSTLELPLAENLRDLGPHIQRRYTAHICDERSYLALLKCAVLLHATGVDGAALAKRWRLAKREAELLHVAIHHHQDVRALVESSNLTRRAIYRFFAQTGEPGIDAALLSLAHTLATGDLDHRLANWTHQTRQVGQVLNAWFTQHNTQIAPPPLLSGQDVMRVLGWPPGPQIGALLDQLHEEQAAGEILTRQQALAFCERWKTDRANEETPEELATGPA
jgi:tRNA nucleotidyltransferase/poly(A) polymerase